MKNRMILVVMTATLISTSTGCGPIRNFLFGRGAGCGLCNRLAAPAPFLRGPAAVPAAPTCNTPTYIQPGYAAPQTDCGCPTPCQSADVCGNASGYGPVYQPGEVISGYGADPYNVAPVPGAIYPSTIVPGYSDDFGPRSSVIGSGTVTSQYPNWSGQGYRTDKHGDRIIHEDPLPPGAVPVN